MTKPTSIIILTWNCLDMTKKCFESLEKYTQNFELIVVDNGSQPDTIEYLQGLTYFKDLHLIFNNNNMGSPYAWNQGIKVAKHDYIAIVDNDIVFTPHWLDYLQECFDVRPDCGSVSPTTCFCGGSRCDKEIQKKRFEMTQEEIDAYAATLKREFIKCHIFGFCFLTHKRVIDKIGVFDWRRYGLGTFEERDYFWRAKKVGFKTYWAKQSYVHHYGHSSFIKNGLDVNKIHEKNMLIFDKRKAEDANLFVENDAIA